MVYVDTHFIQFLVLLGTGFISGKFISTSLIQFSIWERVKGLGIEPPLTSSILIYLKQTFCGWGTNLAPRCLLISLLTSLIFVTFWVRYGFSFIFIFCCLYSLFGQIYLFSWIDDREVPEGLTSLFIFIGNISVYFVEEYRLANSILLTIIFFIIKHSILSGILKFQHNIYFRSLSFIFPMMIWFGLKPTLTILFLAYITAALIRVQKEIKGGRFYYEFLNPIICVFFFIYILFKFPSAL